MEIILSDLYRLVRKLRTLVGNEFEMQLGGDPVPPYLPVVLGAAVQKPGSHIQELVEATGLAQSVVSKAVTGAHARGWVELRSDPCDGRRSLVFPARSLEQAVQHAHERSAVEVLRPLLGRLTHQEQRTALRGLGLLMKAANTEVDR